MGFWATILQRFGAAAPRAAVQQAGGGKLITTAQELEEYLRSGGETKSGASVTANSSMRVGAVYACVRLISSPVATLPLQLLRRVSDRVREHAADDPLWRVLRRRPNRWQTPSAFKRMLQAHQLLRGNGYALIVRSRGIVQELLPLHPERVEVEQKDDLSIVYHYTTAKGLKRTFRQSEIFHLVGLTFDGVRGVTPITYARETIGLALAMEEHGAKMFKHGARVSGMLKHPQTLGTEGTKNLQASLEAFRAGGESEGRDLILEEGMEYTRMGLTAEDAQYIESRKFTRSDIAMFFGVPPHMIGDTEKATSWGSGIEQQTIGFSTYTLEDYLTMWEETIDRDLIPENDDKLFAKFNRSALVRADFKTRWEGYSKARQMKVLSANDVRALEDMNPYEGGDAYENPLTAPAADAGETEPNPGGTDEPEAAAQS